MVGVCAGALVAAGAVCHGGPLRPLLEARPLEWLGRISYSVYLWHKPIVEAVAHHDTVTKVAKDRYNLIVSSAQLTAP